MNTNTNHNFQISKGIRSRLAGWDISQKMNNSESPNRRVAKQTSFTSFQSPSTTSQSLSDYFTKSTYGSARIGDPKTQLLHRWQGLAQQMSQTQMAWDVVIALNRNLDQVEDMLSHKAPLDNYQNLRGWDRGLGILHMEDSGVDVGYESETTPPASNAPKELELSHVGNTDDPMCSTALLERVTHAIKQLRDRQKEFRVCKGRYVDVVSFKSLY